MHFDFLFPRYHIEKSGRKDDVPLMGKYPPSRQSIREFSDTLYTTTFSALILWHPFSQRSIRGITRHSLTCMATILGIDVGGTSTDAVLLDAAGVRAKAKVETTDDIYSGIYDAVAHIERQHDAGTSSQEKEEDDMGHARSCVVLQRYERYDLASLDDLKCIWKKIYRPPKIPSDVQTRSS